MSVSPAARRTQEERRAETRGKLLDATIASLEEVGYQATTTRRIAELAGVSQGAITHHFPHRADLVAAAVERMAELRLADLTRRAGEVSRARGDVAEALLDLLWDDYSSGIFEVIVKLWIAAADDPDLHARLVPLERRVSRAIGETARAVSTPLARQDDFEARLHVLLATLRGLALSQAFEPGAPRRARSWPAVRSVLLELFTPPS